MFFVRVATVDSIQFLKNGILSFVEASMRVRDDARRDKTVFTYFSADSRLIPAKITRKNDANGMVTGIANRRFVDIV